ncbi:HTH domain protein [Roseovarius sp. THAF8]|uniref:helix-turn-helix transcriptional regulator n=1 Tax=Roseovarius sp. THAF8 TaxID=2587846 RepID=UPI00126975DF|nr:YafY family protein [Roseovarius sp. THAF8]QFT97792.1 HTH domain protein [Roseovarius sp. THAF8]
MTRSTRLFDIIQILRSADAPVTAAMLAEELEVTKRTIYRDVVALQALRVPVEGAAGVGYMMRAGYDLPPLMFSAEELEALYVGMALLHRTGDPGLERAARRAGEKIATALPGGAPHVPLRVSGWNRIPRDGVDAEALRAQIRDAVELRIVYVDLQEARTERVIRPVALTYHIDAVVLAAWCALRQGFRSFRIDRIVESVPTGEGFAGEAAALRAAWEATLEGEDWVLYTASRRA